jgi:hypothetical protein
MLPMEPQLERLRWGGEAASDPTLDFCRYRDIAAVSMDVMLVVCIVMVTIIIIIIIIVIIVIF